MAKILNKNFENYIKMALIKISKLFAINEKLNK